MAKDSTSPAHTAGPWFISYSENPDVYRGQEHLMIVDEPTHTCVADIETKTEAEANACLIAAAPELLERAKMSLADAEEALAHPEKVAGYNWQSIADDIRMIIAKAEGRS